MAHLYLCSILQTRSLIVYALLVLIPATVCQNLEPPGPPQITAPDVIFKNQTVTLVCTVTGGSPAPTVKWYRDNIVIDDTSTNSGDSHINQYAFVATDSEHLEVFECQTENGILQNPLTRTAFIEVFRAPASPTLIGPTSVISGTSHQWNCTSYAGYPAPNMQMRVGNSIFSSNQFTVTSHFDNAAKTYTLTGILSWSPTTAHNRQILYCDVYYSASIGIDNQTVSLQLTVQSPISVYAPQISYNAIAEQTLSINCVVSSGTATTITWYKNNQPISISSDARLSGGVPSSPSLGISRVQSGDAGTYQCQATDGAAIVRTNVITVTVTDPDLTEADIITAILSGYNKLVRPTPSPNITHSIHPTRIVTCAGKTLVLQGYTCMYWYDQRLTWTRGQDSVSLPSSEIWLPDVTQEGEKPDFYTSPVWSADKVVVTKDGMVGFCPQGLFATHNCAEKAGEKHQCTMKFRSWTYDKELMDISLPADRESVDISGLEVHQTYEIDSKCAVRNERTYACCGSRFYPDVTYTIVWKRRRNVCVNLSEQPTCNS